MSLCSCLNDGTIWGFYAIWNIPLLPQGFYVLRSLLLVLLLAQILLDLLGSESGDCSGDGVNLRFRLRLVMGDGVGLKFCFRHLCLCASSVLSSGSVNELSLWVDVSESKCFFNDRGHAGV